MSWEPIRGKPANSIRRKNRERIAIGVSLCWIVRLGCNASG
jgi:hypothetical protein